MPHAKISVDENLPPLQWLPAKAFTQWELGVIWAQSCTPSERVRILTRIIDKGAKAAKHAKGC